MKPKIFNLTDEHITLINNFYIDAEDNGVPCVGYKRPFGNSDIMEDVVTLLDWGVMEEDEDGELILEPYEDRYDQIMGELATALQIVCCTKSFTPGTYKKTDEYDSRSWKLCEVFI